MLGGIHILSGFFEHSGLWLWRIEDVSHLGKGSKLMDGFDMVFGGCF